MTDATQAAHQTHSNETAYQTPGAMGLMQLSMHWGIATLSVALLLGFAVWAVGIGTRDPSEVPIIRAMEGPARIKPDVKDAGGTQAPHQGLAVNTVQSGQTETEIAAVSIAPAPETVPAKAGAAPADIQSAIETATLETDQTVAQELVPEPQLDTELAQAEPDLTLLPASNISGNAFSPVVSLRPRARPNDLRSEVAVIRIQQVAAQPNPPAPAPTGVQPGARLIQLGAYDTERQAKAQWDLLALTHADLLRGKDRIVQRADSGGRVFYRLRASGFQSLEESKALCSAMLARGAPCIPVTAR